MADCFAAAGSTLVSACTVHTWELSLAACWGIQLLLVSFTLLAATMISCLLTSSSSPSQLSSVHCEWASKRDSAKFRDLIRKIKQKADLA
jgi:hypothetical protein